ncbi:PIH1D1 family protein [Megaselia abdita]
MSNFLDSSPDLFERNLKFVNKELEQEIDSLLDPKNTSRAGIENLAVSGKERDYKIVKPYPGICVKCFKCNTDEKFFINICQTDDIPPPEDISEKELDEILNSNEPSTFRIPMSISQPRLTLDKSDNKVDVVDVAISAAFLRKCEKSLLFSDFLIACIHEAINNKYQITLNSENFIVLKNRKSIGTLISHRVENRDVKKGYEMLETSDPEEKIRIMNASATTKKPLIQEISSNEKSQLVDKTKKKQSARTGDLEKIKKDISQANSALPEFNIIGILKEGTVNELLAQFHLPKCTSVCEITLDVGEDRILLESMKRGYLFEKFFDYSFNPDKVIARFDKSNRMLHVKVPLAVK